MTMNDKILMNQYEELKKKCNLEKLLNGRSDEKKKKEENKNDINCRICNSNFSDMYVVNNRIHKKDIELFNKYEALKEKYNLEKLLNNKNVLFSYGKIKYYIY